MRRTAALEQLRRVDKASTDILIVQDTSHLQLRILAIPRNQIYGISDHEKTKNCGLLL
jgi:hypothetical protein